MDLTLSPEHQQLVQELVESGAYASAGDVLGQALSLLRQRDEENERLNELRREIALGLDDVKQGRLVPGKDAVRELRHRLQRESQP